MTALRARAELIDLLHRIDGQLGLTVYRAEHPSTYPEFLREATALIQEVRDAIKDLEETLTDPEKPAPAPAES